MIDANTQLDDIPWFLNCQNPDVQKAREEARKNPVPFTDPNRTGQSKKTIEPDTLKFIEEEKNRERQERENRKHKKTLQEATKELPAEACWDTMRAKWVLPNGTPIAPPRVTIQRKARRMANVPVTTAADITPIPTGDIPAGAEVLQSTFDPRIVCYRTPNSKKVTFRGQETTLSKAALTVAREHGKNWPTIQGPLYWTLNGVKLAKPKGK